jgi:hypothetical protein
MRKRAGNELIQMQIHASMNEIEAWRRKKKFLRKSIESISDSPFFNNR